MPAPLSGTRLFTVQKDAPAPAEGAPRLHTFRANDGDFDRYNDRLSIQGWMLDAFNVNPVVLYNHDDGSGGLFGTGRKDVLPIGKGRAYVQGDALLVDIEFDQEDDFARKVESKVARGILNAVSVRYLMHRYHENERGGFDCEQQELLEISIVTIPGNQRAVRVKELADERAAFIQDVAKAVVATLDERERSKVALPPAPDVNALAKHTAEALLQHFKEMR
ncbi:HK97 family phage prohead protease [Myxococcus sp. AM011]|uniref:HK97 family phage prohead protease n=1 Tax=Myxococcus sp. AM011 TaxID=2745200 RepID=UPI0015959602|nr:HK97 family phage prohead protease [Myxococcus sp. AM011]NVJ20645.1 HK97 family phage prohead protease [Myxococcus sp. AM011]